jgi:hypothetical protein
LRRREKIQGLWSEGTDRIDREPELRYRRMLQSLSVKEYNALSKLDAAWRGSEVEGIGCRSVTPMSQIVGRGSMNVITGKGYGMIQRSWSMAGDTRQATGR